MDEAPTGRALEDRQLLRSLGDFRNQLQARGGGSDHGYALACEVQALRPPARVEAHGTEQRLPFNLGNEGPIELADCADEGAHAGLFLARTTPQLHVPDG